MKSKKYRCEQCKGKYLHSQGFFSFFFYIWLEFYKHSQFHIATPQRVISIIHYSLTLRNLPATVACTRTLAAGVHRGISDDPCKALLAVLHNP